LIDQSPYTATEANNRPDEQLPTPDELDYALLRLDRPVGAESPTRPKPGHELRGWVRVPATPPALTPGAPILLAHCPEGRPVQLAFESRGVIGVNANGTRMRYRVSTGPGSAGAPCFDQ